MSTTNPPDTDQLLSPAELADYLTIPVQTIYQWRYRGEGPPGYRVGRHVRYRWSDVEAWLADQADDIQRSGAKAEAR